jgi:hypothetical protein
MTNTISQIAPVPLPAVGIWGQAYIESLEQFVDVISVTARKLRHVGYVGTASEEEFGPILTPELLVGCVPSVR